jgi:hypothetical protein
MTGSRYLIFSLRVIDMGSGPRCFKNIDASTHAFRAATTTEYTEVRRRQSGMNGDKRGHASRFSRVPMPRPGHFKKRGGFLHTSSRLGEMGTMV